MQPSHDLIARPRLAGIALIVGALGFVAVFAYLAARIGYPDVLDQPAAIVLPALLAGGRPLRVAWSIYAALPLCIVAAALQVTTPRLPRLVRACGVLAGVAMTAGLLRWSTLQWWLASDWATASEPARLAIAARAAHYNLVLGTVVGEFLGEVLLAAWLVGIGLSLRRRWVGKAAVLLSALMLVGSLRNAIPAAQPVTEVTNGLLPVVLIWLGATWAWRGAPVPRRIASSPAVALVVALLGGPARPARADELPQREVILHGFRSPSIGVELRDGWLGFHVGAYPTILDEADDGARRATWFLKAGLTAYVAPFDAGSGRASSPFVSVGLLQGLSGSWDVSKDATRGSAVMAEVGFRWAAWRGLDVRLGAAILVGFDGRVHVNPTPGFSWAIAY